MKVTAPGIGLFAAAGLVIILALTWRKELWAQVAVVRAAITSRALGPALLALWATLIVAGGAWLWAATPLPMSAARDLPRGTLLDTGDLSIGSGIAVLTRPVKRGERVARADLAQVADGVVPAGSTLALVAWRPTSGLPIARRDRGWLCPASGTGREVQVATSVCGGTRERCFAVVAFGPDAAPAVAAYRSRGLDPQPCRGR